MISYEKSTLRHFLSTILNLLFIDLENNVRNNSALEMKTTWNWNFIPNGSRKSSPESLKMLRIMSGWTEWHLCQLKSDFFALKRTQIFVWNKLILIYFKPSETNTRLVSSITSKTWFAVALHYMTTSFRTLEDYFL